MKRKIGCPKQTIPYAGEIRFQLQKTWQLILKLLISSFLCLFLKWFLYIDDKNKNDGLSDRTEGQTDFWNIKTFFLILISSPYFYYTSHFDDTIQFSVLTKE